ncbi:hypothetical protein [Pseudarthrobacter sp. S9]|uniref:hypothetical protein n=1 Tax=Pseudarthrobacter sp. S9 TaxID=3418421 RepID=UPI003CFD9A4C
MSGFLVALWSLSAACSEVQPMAAAAVSSTAPGGIDNGKTILPISEKAADPKGGQASELPDDLERGENPASCF